MRVNLTRRRQRLLEHMAQGTLLWRWRSWGNWHYVEGEDRPNGFGLLPKVVEPMLEAGYFTLRERREGTLNPSHAVEIYGISELGAAVLAEELHLFGLARTEE